jgi:hypothetical protein
MLYPRFMLPTGAPVGSIKDIESGCACGSDFEVPCMVVA